MHTVAWEAQEARKGRGVSAGRAKCRKANGGCLGVKSRRRTWHTAKSVGEPCAGGDPAMSEWGNPAGEEPVTGRGYRSGGTRGTETSQYPEEKRAFRE